MIESVALRAPTSPPDTGASTSVTPDSASRSAKARVATGLIVNAAHGIPNDALGAVFSDLQIEVLGLEMRRYELNTFVGVAASTACFFGAALWNRRSGAFAERIESLEADLRTPAHADGADLDLRGALAYRLAGRLCLLIGGLLLLMALPVLTDEGAALNLVGGALAVLLGLGLVGWTRRVLRDKPT